MPYPKKSPAALNLKSIIQLIAGLIFIGLGIYILISKFENNRILTGQTKYFFGGILCLYGIVRMGRIYLEWRTKKNYYYEHEDEKLN